MSRLSSFGWIAIGFIVVIGFLIYASALRNDFVSWDDTQLIVRNPLIRSFSPRIFWSYDPELYIPVTLLSYQIEHALFGFNPFFFHVDALILHIVNALLACWFILLLAKKRWLALACAVIFLVHPLNTETVAWASARKELLSTTFFLLSLVAYLQSKERSQRWKWISIVSFLLAMLSKVTVAMLPFVLLLMEWREGKKMSKKVILRTLPYWALGMIGTIIGFLGKAETVDLLSVWQVILLACRSATFYIEKFFVPLHFSAIYPAPTNIAITEASILLSVMIVFGLIAAAWFLRHRIPLFTFGIAFFFFMILPSFLAYQKSNDVILAADHYAYSASLGLIIAAASLFLMLKGARTEKVILTITAIAVVILAVLAHAQSLVWRDTETLFTHVLEMYPTSHVALNNLGFEALMRGEPKKTIELSGKATELNPTYADAYINLGAAYGREKNFVEAEKMLTKALEISPDLPQAHFNLGGVYQARGELDRAVAEYERTIELDPNLAEAYWQLGRMYGKQGKSTESKQMLEKAIEIAPEFMQRLK